jgi:hypothetical protein
MRSKDERCSPTTASGSQRPALCSGANPREVVALIYPAGGEIVEAPVEVLKTHLELVLLRESRWFVNR